MTWMVFAIIVMGSGGSSRVSSTSPRACAARYGVDFLAELGHPARLVHRHFVGHRSVNDALIQVGRGEIPDSAGEMNVVRVVDLAEVVPASWLLREGQEVLAAVVLYLDVALFDVYVGLAVLAHRAELHQVAVGHVLVYGEEHVQVADNVVVLGVDGMAPVDHGVGRRPLLGEVHDGLGLVALHDVGDELPVK